RGGVDSAGAAPRPRALIVPGTLALIAVAVAALVNPWGYRLPQHLLTFFSVRGAALSHTSEFQPPTLGDLPDAAVIGFVVLSLAGLGAGAGAYLRARRRGQGMAFPFHPATLAGFGVTTVMALRSIRDLEIMAIFGAIVLADGLSAWIRLGAPGVLR